jgi:hypothetical protein
MRQAIRALGWATKILWIILIALIITIAYSATLINIAFGESQTTATEQTVTISFPISIQNKGFYDIAQLNITTYITDTTSQTLARGTTISQLIPRGTDATLTHSMAINITQILTQNSDLLFNDNTFTFFQHISLNYAKAIPLKIHANQTMPWGAPLSNLTIGQITYQAYNVTHSLASVQLSFENHNQYISVQGLARIEMYNNRQTLMGSGTTNVDAQPNSPSNAQINVLVENSKITPSGQIHLFFETPAFNYGPITIPYGNTPAVTPYD